MARQDSRQDRTFQNPAAIMRSPNGDGCPAGEPGAPASSRAHPSQAGAPARLRTAAELGQSEGQRRTCKVVALGLSSDKEGSAGL